MRDTFFASKDLLHVVSVGVQGPRGPQGIPGPSGGGSFERVSSEGLSALRVVWEDSSGVARPLDYRDTAHINLLAGITVTAAYASGQAVTVQRTGPLEAEGLGLVPGRVWLGVDGTLTQTPPTDGFDVLVGYATEGQRIYLVFSEPIHME